MFNSGFRGRRENDGQGSINPQAQYVQTKSPQPYISGWSISGSDDTALNPAGGQTVLVNGSGFAAGVSATVGGSQIASVTLVKPTQISFTAPANAGGSYTLIVYNSSGGAAILVPGLTYSSVPTWTTAAGSIGSYYETTAIASNVVATSDSAITYSLASGSLPTGATLYANGVITGTAPVDSGSTTYTFNITATDAEQQDTTRTFTMTINTDVVTWNSPAAGTTYTLNQNTAMSNVTLSASDAAGYAVSYSANTLPTGVSVSGNVVYGTPTVEGSTSSLFTATAATTGRTATRVLNWTVQLPNDAYFKYVTTLLSPTGPASTFVDDASTNNFAVTINSGVSPSSRTPYTPGYYSNYFDGTGDYISAASSSALNFGTGSFTVECWVYFNSLSNIPFIFNKIVAGSGWFVEVSASTLYFGFGSATSGQYWQASVTLVTGVWYHIAVTRVGAVLSAYVNGAKQSSTLTGADSSYDNAAAFVIGSYSPTSASYDLNGYISNFRVVKSEVYTATFTPPTSPLTAIANTSLLTCQSNRLIDNSTNAFTVTKNGDTAIKSSNPFAVDSSYATYGSAFFNSNYLSLPSSSNLTLTGDFTIEFWIYCNGSYNNQGILGGAATNIGIYTDSGGYFQIDANNSNFAYNSDSTRILDINQWTHVAISRSGSTMYLFKNGVSRTLSLVGSPGSTTYDFSAGTPGQAQSPVKNARAWISDLRIVKGTAIYTSGFTPPSAPLTAVANTQLLTLQNNQPVNNSTFLDSSNNAFAITRNGNTSQGTFNPYTSTWSNYFDGTGDYLTGTIPTAIGTGDYTFEAWVYRTGPGSSNSSIFTMSASSSLYVQFYDTYCRFWENSDFIQYNGISYNTWYHIAGCRASGTLRLFINGTQQGSKSTSFNIITTQFYIGSYDTTQNFINGYISNLRLVVGSALYTSSFTPSTAPLTAVDKTSLLTCQSPRFVDNSPNNLALTKGGDTSVQKFSPFSNYTVAPTSYSGYFDGTGDYLTLPNNAAFTMGTGDFTMELWWYHTSVSTNGIFSTSRIGTGGANGVMMCGDTVYIGTSSAYTALSWTLPLNQWNHLAVTRSSGVIRTFVNGTQAGTTSTVYNMTGTTCVVASQYTDTFYSAAGYASNVRVIKGQALYTTTFTPATSPLTTTSQGATAANVSLLTCQSSTFIDNSTNAFTVTANGDSKLTVQNPFGSTTSAVPVAWSAGTFGGSMYFDGTGDYLTLTGSPLGSGDFTIEMWTYMTSYPNAQNALYSNGTSDNSSSCIVYINSSGTFAFYNSSSITTSTTVPTNCWNHLAVVRNSNTVKLYINGVSGGSGSNNNTISATDIQVMRGYGSITSSPIGYVSNLRVVAGTAVYTANFVPPAAPVAAIGNTVLLPAANPAIVDYSMINDFETAGDAKIVTSTVKYGYNSIYLDGSGDYLYAPSSQSVAFGTGDFTVEFWVYPTVNARQDWIDCNSGSPRFLIYYDGTNIIYYSTSARITGGGITLNTWQYITLCRSSGSTKLFINGTQSGSTYADTINYGASALNIGRDSAGSTYATGYMSDIRITQGYARYTTNFTPPTDADKTS